VFFDLEHLVILVLVFLRTCFKTTVEHCCELKLSQLPYCVARHNNTASQLFILCELEFTCWQPQMFGRRRIRPNWNWIQRTWTL